MTRTEQMAQIAIAQSPKSKRKRFSPYIVTAAILPIILLVWWLATSVTKSVSPILLPTPESVWAAIPRVLGAMGFGDQVMRTIIEIAGGFLLGGLIGFGLGMLLSASNRLRGAYLPFLSALEAIPTVIIAPIIIAWIGFGIEGKILQAAIACFYAVFITTLSGLGLAEPNAINLMRSLRASKWQIMTKVRIPTALPVIFGGLQLGATTAIIGAIVSEFIGSTGGLGYLMLRYRGGYDTAAYWVIIFIFLIIGLAVYLGIWYVEKKVVFWRDVAITRPDLEKA
jgi:NitT/TauT family transport system permease protein